MIKGILTELFLNRKYKIATHIGDVVINGNYITGRPLSKVYENYYIDLITGRTGVLVDQLLDRDDIIQIINVELVETKTK
ncbi:MAG: hypothetical protein WC917_04895 [Bacilli bacterium]|jgi:hypothetical protein